jgi:hypothetical protein
MIQNVFVRILLRATVFKIGKFLHYNFFKRAWSLHHCENRLFQSKSFRSINFYFLPHIVLIWELKNLKKNWEVLYTGFQNGGDFQNGWKFSFSTITQCVLNFFAFCWMIWGCILVRHISQKKRFLSDSRWRLLSNMPAKIQSSKAWAFSNIFTFCLLQCVCIYVSNIKYWT